MGVGGEQVEGVVKHKKKGDDDGLGDFDAVDTRQHVDALGAEHGDAGHVEVVEEPQVEELTQIRLERNRDDDGRDIEVDEVDDQDGNGGQGRDPPLVTPTDVEEVVAEAEEGDGLE